MEKPDSQTDSKTRGSQWAFTAYEHQWKYFDDFKIEGHPVIRMLKWQTEKCPDSGRLHYQGAIHTYQCRHSTLRSLFPGVHIGKAREWHKLLSYVKKNDTAIPDTRVTLQNEEVREFYSFDDKMVMLSDAWAACNADDAEAIVRYKLDNDSQDAEFWWLLTHKVLPMYGRQVAGAFADPAVRTFWRHTSAFWLRQDQETRQPLSITEVGSSEDLNSPA